MTETKFNHLSITLREVFEELSLEKPVGEIANYIPGLSMKVG